MARGISPEETQFTVKNCSCDYEAALFIDSGNLFYHCWYNACNFLERWCGIDDITFVNVTCNKCHVKARVRISKTSRNPGKLYYKCPNGNCDFFLWWKISVGGINQGVISHRSDTAFEYSERPHRHLPQETSPSSSARNLTVQELEQQIAELSSIVKHLLIEKK